ncbi:LysR family transcriptional regulator [bacterium]|nr:LysR family transcriptional regulator [bacterium]MCB2179076.1 LysR family transcriptional regulator [bacterium]
MIDLTRLKAFIFSAETLSFSEASKQLHLTQPTISHHIKTLEQALGVELFIRKGNKLELTEAGRMLIPWARKLIRQSNEIKDLMTSIQQEAVGNLRIACSTASGKYVLPHLAARFRLHFPGVHISILPCAPEQMVRRLLDNEAHLGVVSSEMIDPSMESQTLYVDTIHLLVPIEHPFVQAEKVYPADLLNENIISREPGSGTRRVVLSELAKHDISYDDLNVFLELGNAEGIVQMVAAGYGIAFVSELIANEALDSKKVAVVKVEELTLLRRVFMVRKAIQTPLRVTEAFWTFVHDPMNKDILPTPFSRPIP